METQSAVESRFPGQSIISWLFGRPDYGKHYNAWKTWGEALHAQPPSQMGGEVLLHPCTHSGLVVLPSALQLPHPVCPRTAHKHLHPTLPENLWNPRENFLTRYVSCPTPPPPLAKQSSCACG